MSVNILIADDHEIFRRGVKQLLLDMRNNILISEVSTGQEVIEEIWRKDYIMVLLDIAMPGRNGIDILKQLKNDKPDLKVLMLSMYPEDQFAIRALKAGADGYVTKKAKPDELKTAVQRILNGKKYVSHSLADNLINYVESGNKKASHENLSDREYEVLHMTASGKSVKDMAMELSLSDKTISTYRARILNKMNMKNIAQVIQYAIQNNILDQPRE